MEKQISRSTPLTTHQSIQQYYKKPDKQMTKMTIDCFTPSKMFRNVPLLLPMFFLFLYIPTLPFGIPGVKVSAKTKL